MLHPPNQKSNPFTTSSVLVWLVELLGVSYVFLPPFNTFSPRLDSFQPQAKTVVAPLDRVKILFQASNPDFQKYAGRNFVSGSSLVTILIKCHRILEWRISCWPRNL